MTVRAKLALTIFATGLVTALLVIATVLYAFQRFEHETAYRRGTAFLGRVVATYVNVFEMHAERPAEFRQWLRNMVLFEPDTQLYLLGLDGAVLASSGDARLAPGFKVALGPVLEAVGRDNAAYVMGDDPERMDADAVVAVQPVRRSLMRRTDPVDGYLYLVLHTGDLPGNRWAILRMSFVRPALWLIAGIVALTTLLSVAIIASVTRPLRRLTEAVATLSQRGLDAGLAEPTGLSTASPDEFGRLASAFEMMLATLRRQWGELRRLDHFRREGVSNLSHDLRSPLTATVACLETLDARWATESESRADDRRLVEIALRNTRNAARLVQSLGDLSKLDEPEFRLHPQVVDVRELLDDIAIRFADRAARQSVDLHAEAAGREASPAFAALDIELFERAVANLIDNALKFCPPGARITLAADVPAPGRLRVQVADTGAGISPEHLPFLFDRFYQARQNVAPATGEGGKGLGLAIVRRIVELHGGEVRVDSRPGEGTEVVLELPGVALWAGSTRVTAPGIP